MNSQSGCSAIGIETCKQKQNLSTFKNDRQNKIKLTISVEFIRKFSYVKL